MQNNRRSLTLDGPVAVGTDGTPEAHRAVRWAATEADSRERPLTIVHATRTESGHLRLSRKGIGQARDHAGDVLAEAEALAGKTAPGVTITTASCPYETADCLLRQAGQEGTVVVGTRGHGGFLGLLVGSDALRVAARAAVPTVVVPPRERDRPAGVVMVAARDDQDRDAIRLAADLALRRGASLRVVTVWIFLENVGSMATMFDDPSELAATESAEVSRLVDRMREDRPGLDIAHDVVRAASAAAVLVAATAEADTVVIGSRRRSLAIGAPLGHVTHAVLHHAHCPILLTPLSDHGPPERELPRGSVMPEFEGQESGLANERCRLSRGGRSSCRAPRPEPPIGPIGPLRFKLVAPGPAGRPRPQPRSERASEGVGEVGQCRYGAATGVAAAGRTGGCQQWPGRRTNIPCCHVSARTGPFRRAELHDALCDLRVGPTECFELVLSRVRTAWRLTHAVGADAGSGQPAPGAREEFGREAQDPGGSVCVLQYRYSSVPRRPRASAMLRLRRVPG